MSNATKFKQVVKNRNFMTPELERYGQQGDFVYELSSGQGMTGNTVYGVTVVDLRTKEHRHDLSNMFHSYKEANDYINDLEKSA